MICPPIVAPYRLGSLCKRGHDHAGTGMSLRRVYDCVRCSNMNATRYARKTGKIPWVDHVERRRQNVKAVCPYGHEKSRGKCPTCQSVYGRMWYASNRARVLKNVAAWRAENPDRVESAQRKFKSRHPAYRREENRAHARRKIVDRVPPEFRAEREKIYDHRSALLRIYKEMKR